MRIMIINFPLKKTLRNLVELLAAGFAFLSFNSLGQILSLIEIYLLITPMWWIPCIYLIWVYLDRETPENRGRVNKWISSLSWWKYTLAYFKPQVVLDSECFLNYKKNYLFCCFPHGILPIGSFCNFLLEQSDFRKLYLKFQVKLASRKEMFWLPWTREILLSLGGISCSAESLKFSLTKSEGGNIIILYPGGVAEGIYAKPSKPHIFVVKKRKGFVRIALQTGTPLVPVITFRELHTFDQIQNPTIFKFQNHFKKYFGFVPFLLLGRGLFQTLFGIFPRKTQLITVLGKPIPVNKSENPTIREIDEVHTTFMQALVTLFDKYKDAYLINNEEKHLELI